MAPKNKKGEKMSLGDFLGDQALGSWADEMEDAPMPRAGGFGGASYGGGSDRPSYGGGSGFGARTDSFADRGFAMREELPMPSKPPYTAHLGNLSFDATEGDVTDFFAGCEVTNVRIVEDKLDRKPKGFGYVEFGTVDGLKKALDLSGSQFQGRNVRVSVAEPPKDRPEARDISDWSRKGPLPDLPNSRPSAGRGYSSRGFDAGASDAGSDRGERRRPAFESDGKQRDFGNWERKGPLSPSAEAPREGGRRFDGPREPREGGYRERQSPAWGEGRPEGERAPRREFQPAEGRPQYERQPTAADQDSQWRTKMRTDVASPSGTPEGSTPSSPAPLASRPKLNLAKRTVSEAPAATTSTPSDKPNPFGAARPIDTAAREREVEEKQKQAVQAKKEADDKAREEKKAKEAAAKEAASKADESKADTVPEAIENPEAEATDEAANGDITDDKAVKPQEPVVAPKDGGSWRRKSSTPAAAPAATTETLEDDGWSTVTKAPKNTRNNRRGGAPARAIAS